MPNYFDVLAPIYEKVHIGAKATFRKLTSVVEFSVEDEVVDVGGGTGRVAKFLTGKVKKVTVVDPSEKMIEQCRKHNGIACLIGTAEKLPFADNSIDKIIMVDVFHHLPNQVQCAQEIKRVLKYGGAVIVEEFNPLTFGGRVIVRMEKFLKMGSVFYSPDNLSRLFSEQGFTVQVTNEGTRRYYLVGIS